MPAPIIAALLGGMTAGPFGSALGLASGLAGGGRGHRRHRRRARGLTKRQMGDILFIKDAVGKTAAANYINLIRGSR